MQSLDDRFLTQLGRIHDAACARESVELVRDSGFSNLSLDLMFGLPGQTFQEWRNDLQEAIRLAPQHLSLYALTLEPGTPFFELEAQKKLLPMDPDRAADMFEYCIDYCSANNYRQYELSNYCQAGAESLHNLLYWTNGSYLGLGVSAASHIAGYRWANARDQDRYSGGLQNGEPQLEYVERLSPRRRAAEEIILRLRLAQGADLDALSEVHGFSLRDTYSVQLRELAELELVEAHGGRLVLTRKGTLLASEVACYFL
jgi:oxygen-independent coproporphyrinogen-3 oxidase